jgi:hypothetical protein
MRKGRRKKGISISAPLRLRTRNCNIATMRMRLAPRRLPAINVAGKRIRTPDANTSNARVTCAVRPNLNSSAIAFASGEEVNIPQPCLTERVNVRRISAALRILVAMASLSFFELDVVSASMHGVVELESVRTSPRMSSQGHYIES